MNALILLAVQSLFAGTPPEDPLPKIGDLETRSAEAEPYPWLGIEVLALRTSFEGGLHIEDRWGYGADATVTLDYGKKSFLGFRLGYIGWNTRTENGVVEESVWVRQYRIGIFGAFQFRFLEFKIGANTGGYRFRRDGDNDTAGFFEFEAMLGARPNEFVWIGIVAMQTFTVSDFSHSTNHAYTNYSIGPSVEVRF